MKRDLVSLLVHDDNVKDLAGYLYTNPVEKYSLRIAIILAGASLPLIYLNLSRETGGWLSLIAAAMFLLYSISYFVWNLRYIALPTKSYFLDLQKRVSSEERIINALSLENRYQLSELYRRLKFERERLNARIGFLIGAIDKLGLLPAVIALYFTYVKAMNDKSLDTIPYPILSFIVGIYIGCIIVKKIIDRIDHMCLAVEVAMERSEAIEDIRQHALTKA
ncbi:hypothetical protein PTW35_09015 [Photobacterium sp. DA100]|uniref:hypothetical protein n=1 Tax=Photobacterium sp. DA100 TaxID=3027472 RepID=UPI00247AA2C5|nr:hypothetical protein [Photobacterium sp. DA100]WEM43897.1 hypothetical protein PTW35_09015 [Photobacterium sp. DA100]